MNVVLHTVQAVDMPGWNKSDVSYETYPDVGYRDNVQSI